MRLPWLASRGFAEQRHSPGQGLGSFTKQTWFALCPPRLHPPHRHPRESGDPETHARAERRWIPTFVGMTSGVGRGEDKGVQGASGLRPGVLRSNEKPAGLAGGFSSGIQFRMSESRIDLRLKLFVRHGARGQPRPPGPAGDDGARRTGDSRRAATVQILLDAGGEFSGFKTSLELALIQADFAGPNLKVVGAEGLLVIEQLVGVFPELALFGSALGGDGGRLAERMERKREMPINPPHLAVVLLQEPLHGRMKTLAERTLEVRVLD